MTKNNPTDTPASVKKYAIQPKLWIGFVAAAFCILMAAGLGNLIGLIFPSLTEAEEFALSHFIPLPIAIAVGYLFLKKAGWLDGVFRSTPAYKDKHRRRWLLIFPLLLAVQAAITLIVAPWSESSVAFVLIALFACILVGINEELYFRGILRFTADQLKSQTFTLFIVSIAFGLAHSFSSIFEGLPLAFIAFQVAATAGIGVVYYAAFIATGRLWVPIVFHVITDFTLRVSNGETGIGPVSSGDPHPASVAIQAILMALILPLVISTIRYDLKVRKDKASINLE